MATPIQMSVTFTKKARLDDDMIDVVTFRIVRNESNDTCTAAAVGCIDGAIVIDDRFKDGSAVGTGTGTLLCIGRWVILIGCGDGSINQMVSL